MIINKSELIGNDAINIVNTKWFVSRASLCDYELSNISEILDGGR